MSGSITYQKRETTVDRNLTVVTRGTRNNSQTMIETTKDRPAIMIELTHEQAVKFTKQHYTSIYHAYAEYELAIAKAANQLRDTITNLVGE